MVNMDFLNGMWFVVRAVAEASGIYGPPGVSENVYQFLVTKSTYYATRVDGIELSAYTSGNEAALTQLLTDTQIVLFRLLSDPANGFLKPGDIFILPITWGASSIFGTMGRDLVEIFGLGAALLPPASLSDVP